jgi:hypothetical protein
MRCRLLKACQFSPSFVSYFYRKDLLVVIRFLVDESCDFAVVYAFLV